MNMIILSSSPALEALVAQHLAEAAVAQAQIPLPLSANAFIDAEFVEIDSSDPLADLANAQDMAIDHFMEERRDLIATLRSVEQTIVQSANYVAEIRRQLGSWGIAIDNTGVGPSLTVNLDNELLNAVARINSL